MKARKKHYTPGRTWQDRKRDQEAIAFICLLLLVLIGIVSLIANWLNF